MDNKIGQYIKKLRKEKGLTQEELGAKLFVTGSSVSKWERGLSLPDVITLNKLAKLFNIEMVDLINGGDDEVCTVDIDSKIEIIKKRISEKNKIRLIRLIILLIVFLLIIIYFVFININYGFYNKDLNYEHSNRIISIGIPKLSFNLKSNDQSYSFKNLSSKNVLNTDIKNYLGSLDYSTCNDTIYYYDRNSNFSIIDYSIKEHYLYRTVSYEIVDYDYCEMEMVKEYGDKLKGLSRMHIYGDGVVYSDEKVDNKLIILMRDGDPTNFDKIYEKKITMEIYYYTNIQNFVNKKTATLDRTVVEISTGDYEIKDNKLYYYRREISEQSSKVKIPEVSVFEILDNGDLLLLDSYLDKYAINIVLD